MDLRRIGWHWVSLGLVYFLAACQASAPPAVPEQRPGGMQFDLSFPWGGEVRCTQDTHPCRLVAIEHEEGQAVLIELDPQGARRLDEQAVAYHPDSAKWLADDLVAAAVEKSQTLDVFRVNQGKMTRISQVPLDFAPRDVVLVERRDNTYRLLATPYAGSEVAWIEWNADRAAADAVQYVTWCGTPWHPVHVTRLPGQAAGGFAAACLDGKNVVGLHGDKWREPAYTLASFEAVPRAVSSSPSGKWLYVALETGERNARINMHTGELQWIAGTRRGAVAAATLADDLVIWGEDRRLRLQRLDDAGAVLETRVLPASGFSTTVQLSDINHDGVLDAVVLNSTGVKSDVLFGPLWERATPLK